MAVRIRLQRFGKTHTPFYRIVAAESTKKRDGKFLALLGTYNPIDGKVEINKPEADRWYRNGALPTDTVRTLLKKNKIVLSKEKPAEEPVVKKVAKPAPKKPVAKSAPKKVTTVKKETATKTVAEKPAAKTAKAEPAKKATSAKPATKATAEKKSATAKKETAPKKEAKTTKK